VGDDRLDCGIILDDQHAMWHAYSITRMCKKHAVNGGPSSLDASKSVINRRRQAIKAIAYPG
jgi:hypothetical protein